MQARMMWEPREASWLRGELAERLGLGTLGPEAVGAEGGLLGGDWLVGAAEVRRLVERFETLAWPALLPILTVVLTLVLGVFAGAHLLALAI